MTHHMLIGLFLGAGLALSLWLTVYGALPRSPGRRTAQRRWRLPFQASGRQWLVAAVTAALTIALTGWPVAGLLTMVGVLTLPRLLGRDRQAAARTTRLEAVAIWAEMLRDTLSAAAGLEQAILATAPIAPPALREQTAALRPASTTGTRWVKRCAPSPTRSTTPPATWSRPHWSWPPNAKPDNFQDCLASWRPRPGNR